VLGDEAALSDGILLAGLDAYRGRVVAEELVLGQLLQSVDPILFAHRIVRIAVYGLLEPGERLALHAGAAKLLAGNGAEPEIAAEHVLLTGPTHEAWALAMLGTPLCERVRLPPRCATCVMRSKRRIRVTPPRECSLISVSLKRQRANRCH
jgi:hypothetical protein